MDAYVCIGTSSDGPHTWVMTLSKKKRTKSCPNGVGVKFWESLTGQHFKISDPQTNQLYRRIGSVFNHESFYGNIQANDQPFSTDFDLSNPNCWKPMDPAELK